MRRTGVLLLGMVLVACGRGAGPSTTAPAPAATSTSATEIPTPTTTATTTTATATTTAPVSQPPVVLAADGLGIVDLGDPVEEAIATLIAALGPPTADNVERGPFQGGMTSGGFGGVDYYRDAWWEELCLSVVFSDAAYYRDDGVPHLIAWYHFDGGDGHCAPLATAAGIGLGATVTEVQEAYGAALHLPELIDECAGWNAAIDGLRVTFDPPPQDAAARVITLHGGFDSSC